MILHYMNAIRRFMKTVWREPQALMMGSLIGALLSLPIVTIGISLAVTIRYMYCREAGIRTSFREALSDVRPALGKAAVMGLIDLLAVVSCVSSAGILWAQGIAAVKFLYAVLLYAMLIYLASAFYRYPILVHNQSLSIFRITKEALTALTGSIGYSFMYLCTLLLALMICAATGVGLLLLLPGANALLMAVAWNETLKRYQGDEGEQR